MFHHRILAAPVLAFAGAGIVLSAASAPQSAQLLDTAKASIGIRSGGPTIASLRVTGTALSTQTVITDSRAGVFRSGTSEWPLVMAIVLPDRYRAIRLTRSGSEWRQTFDGRRATEESYVRVLLARLMLGMIAYSEVVPGTTVRPTGTDEVYVEGNSRGAHPLRVTVTFDRATHLPVRVTWRERRTVHQPESVLGPISDGGGGTRPIGPETPEVDVTMTFSERRDVRGFKLPFRITTTARGVTTEEMRFTEIEVNPSLRDEDFR